MNAIIGARSANAAIVASPIRFPASSGKFYSITGSPTASATCMRYANLSACDAGKYIAGINASAGTLNAFASCP